MSEMTTEQIAKLMSNVGKRARERVAVKAEPTQPSTHTPTVFELAQLAALLAREQSMTPTTAVEKAKAFWDAANKALDPLTLEFGDITESVFELTEDEWQQRYSRLSDDDQWRLRNHLFKTISRVEALRRLFPAKKIDREAKLKQLVSQMKNKNSARVRDPQKWPLSVCRALAVENMRLKTEQARSNAKGGKS